MTAVYMPSTTAQCIWYISTTSQATSSLLLRPPILHRSLMIRHLALVDKIRALKELEHLVDQSIITLASRLNLR